MNKVLKTFIILWLVMITLFALFAGVMWAGDTIARAISEEFHTEIGIAIALFIMISPVLLFIAIKDNES